MGAGALGRAIDEWNGDNFDHSGLGFIGGGFLSAMSFGSRPIGSHPVPSGTPRWGSGWKRAVARYFNRSFEIDAHGACQSYRTNYLDLDPTYRDAQGQPLLRMTFDFHENEYRMARYLAGKAARDRAGDRASTMSTSTRSRVPTASCPIRPPTTPAGRSWALIPRRARSTSTCSRGTCPTSSWSGPAPSPRTPATTRAVRWQP